LGLEFAFYFLSGISSLGVWILSMEFGVWSFGVGVSDFEFRISDFRFQTPGSGSQVSYLKLRVQGSGFVVCGLGFGV